MRRILPTAIWAESQKLPTGCPMWNLLTVSRVTHSASSMPSNFSQLACRMRPRLPSGGYLALKSEPSTSASAAASGMPSSPVTWIREHTPFNPLFLLPQMSFPCLTPAHPSKSNSPCHLPGPLVAKFILSTALCISPITSLIPFSLVLL